MLRYICKDMWCRVWGTIWGQYEDNMRYWSRILNYICHIYTCLVIQLALCSYDTQIAQNWVVSEGNVMIIAKMYKNIYQQSFTTYTIRIKTICCRSLTNHYLYTLLYLIIMNIYIFKYIIRCSLSEEFILKVLLH